MSDKYTFKSVPVRAIVKAIALLWKARHDKKPQAEIEALENTLLATLHVTDDAITKLVELA